MVKYAARWLLEVQGVVVHLLIEQVGNCIRKEAAGSALPDSFASESDLILKFTKKGKK